MHRLKYVYDITPLNTSLIYLSPRNSVALSLNSSWNVAFSFLRHLIDISHVTWQSIATKAHTPILYGMHIIPSHSYWSCSIRLLWLTYDDGKCCFKSPRGFSAIVQEQLHFLQKNILNKFVQNHNRTHLVRYLHLYGTHLICLGWNIITQN